MSISHGRLRKAGTLVSLTALSVARMLWVPFVGLGIERAPDAHRNDGTEGRTQAVKGQTAKPGFVEKAGVSLTLIDVEVTDDHGNPIRGLKKEDFRVRLSRREWPLYSVDDLCTCEEDTAADREERSPHAPEGKGRTAGRDGDTELLGVDPDRPEGAAKSDAGSTAGGNPGARAALSSDLRFVLFFDFGHLAVEGRARAFKEARRWVQEVKKPKDLVAVSGHSPKAGLREICAFTSDTEKLMAALGQAEGDPSLQDAWPSFHEQRWKICAAAGPRNPLGTLKRRSSFTLTEVEGEAEDNCKDLLEEEYRRGEQALKGLKDLVESLTDLPGRKALILFHQTGAVEPGAIYPDIQFPDMIASIRDSTANNLRLVDQLAAEATFAHTTINTAYVGDRMSASPDRPWEEDLYEGSVAAGGVLSEATGGRHNLDLSDLHSLTSGVRSRCMCIYRIGLEARQGEPHGRVYQARVTVRGRRLKPRYRVAFLNEVDRWIREARGVLRNPSRARDLSVGAAIVPMKASDGAWDLSVQLAVDAGSIEFVTSSGGKSGVGGSDASWEAGALLFREEDDKDWEMLGVSGAHRAREGRPAQGQEAVLHEHVFAGVHPGRYRLAAFVKDRSASLYGGAEASLELPVPRAGALTKPVLLLDSRRHLIAPLPIFKARSEGESRDAALRTGAIPAPGRAFRRGEVLVALTWFCRQEKEKPALRRFISKDGAPAFRLAEPRVEPAGDCSRITDRIETEELEAGSYAYNVEYRTSDDARPVSRSQPFTIESTSTESPSTTKTGGKAAASIMDHR